MLRQKRSPYGLAVSACLMACAALAGCGPKGIPGLVAVSGKVYFNGEPLTLDKARPKGAARVVGRPKAVGKFKFYKAKGTIESADEVGSVKFFPDEAKGNTSQHLATGTIDAKGNYRIYTNGQPG